MLKNMMIALGATMLATSGAHAATIIGLYNTGLNQQGTALKSGAGQDQHWDLVGNPQAFTPTTINSAWISNSAAGTFSRWIGPNNPNGNTTAPVGSYQYYLDFTIGSNLNAATASFAGRFAADNTVSSITLNGNTITQAGAGNFNAWTAFSGNSGFVQGLNHLVFTVNNASCSGCLNPTGLRVEFLSSSVSAVPEPASWALMIGGFGVIGGAMRRRAKVAVRASIA